MQMTNRISYLNRCDVFGGLHGEEADHLERCSRLRQFRKGELIYFPTEPAESMLLVVSGRVIIRDITSDGKETILAFIDPGEMFGEVALIDGSERGEYAEAAEDSQVASIPRSEMMRLIEQHRDVSLGVIRLLGDRKRRFEKRFRNTVFRSKREQVCSALVELLEKYGQQVGSAWEIQLFLSHQELASLIGATRETVTIILGQLQLDGLIDVRRRRITVLNRAGLLHASRNPVAA